MTIKTFLGVIFLASCFASSVTATTIKEKKRKEHGVFANTYAKFSTYKKGPVSFVKSHPFITAMTIVTILSSKMRSILINLPKKLWRDIQKHPVAMALLLGFILSYVIT